MKTNANRCMDIILIVPINVAGHFCDNKETFVKLVTLKVDEKLVLLTKWVNLKQQHLIGRRLLVENTKADNVL